MVMRAGDEPRRRRMIRGTIARIGDLDMRYGQLSQLATLECTSSRRNTVMCALPRVTRVTTGYQRDSSSKRPRASVVFAAPPPTVGGPRGGHGVQGFAPRGRRLRRPWTPRPPHGRMHLSEQAHACSATGSDVWTGSSRTPEASPAAVRSTTNGRSGAPHGTVAFRRTGCVPSRRVAPPLPRA